MLRKSSEIYQVEIYHFVKMLEQHGWIAIGVPRYTVPIIAGTSRRTGRTEFLLKVMGDWNSFWLEERSRGVFVIYDRSG